MLWAKIAKAHSFGIRNSAGMFKLSDPTTQCAIFPSRISI